MGKKNRLYARAAKEAREAAQRSETLDRSTYVGIDHSYWGAAIDLLQGIANLTEERARLVRENIYEDVRYGSGLAFEDYGDEPHRWLAWLRENNTGDWEAAKRWREENFRQRGIDPPPFIREESETSG